MTQMTRLQKVIYLLMVAAAVIHSLVLTAHSPNPRDITMTLVALWAMIVFHILLDRRERRQRK